MTILRVLALLTSTLLVATACSSGAGSGSPGEPSPAHGTPKPDATQAPAPDATRSLPPPAVAWKACAGRFLCTSLLVPLDHSGRTPGQLEIAVMKWEASSPASRIGALLVDPGGPGGSGLEFLRGISARGWAALHERFDIVAFDPRGVGKSTHLDCTDSLEGFFEVAPPHSDLEKARLIAEARAFAAGCSARSGELLGFLSGEHVARDMDLVRAALGDAKLTYLGFSYGTYLGAMYAELFPDRVRALVLDGAVDPTLSAADWQLQQAIGFETALHAFLASCAANPGCAFHSEGRPEEAYDEVFAAIKSRPLEVPGSERALGASMAETGVTYALYDRTIGWLLLASALDAAARGDGSRLLALFDRFSGRTKDGNHDDFFEIYKAVTCEDLAFPRDLAAYDEMARRFALEAPRFGPGLAYEHVNCAFWPVPPARQVANRRLRRAADPGRRHPSRSRYTSPLGAGARGPARVGRASHLERRRAHRLRQERVRERHR